MRLSDFPSVNQFYWHLDHFGELKFEFVMSALLFCKRNCVLCGQSGYSRTVSAHENSGAIYEKEKDCGSLSILSLAPTSLWGAVLSCELSSLQ